MDSYTEAQYNADLNNADMPHLETDKRFKAFYDMLGAGPAKDVQYPARMKWVIPKPGAHILELGCSSGYNIVKWLENDRGCSVVGVDVSQAAIGETVRRITQLPTQASMRVSIFETRIEDAPHIVCGLFTDVVLTETLEHVQDPLPVLQVAWGFVASGGTLWITVPSRRWGNYSHVRGIRAATLSSMLQDVGVDVTEIAAIDEVKHQGERLTRAKVIRQ